MENIYLDVVITLIPALLIGYTIFRLTEFSQQLSKTIEHNNQIFRLISNVNANLHICEYLKDVNTKEYMHFFANMLDKLLGKDKIFDDVEDYCGDLIFYDKLIELPDLSDSIIEKFTKSFDEGLKIEELMLLINSSKENKKKFIVETKSIVFTYDVINKKINKINNQLDYYRELSLSFLNLNPNNRDHTNSGIIQSYFLKYCIEYITLEAKVLFDDLNILARTLTKVKSEIDTDQKELNKRIKNLKIFFFATFMVLAIFMIA